MAGLVVDREGKPVAGAEVFVTGWSTNPFTFMQTVKAEGRSDSRGMFTLRPGRDEPNLLPALGRYSYLVYRHDHGMAGGVVRGPSLPPGALHRVNLGHATPAHFLLLDPDGRPLPGGRIAIQSIGQPASFVWGEMSVPTALGDRLAVETGSDGKATSTAVALEEIRSVRVTTNEFGSQIVRFSERSPGVKTIRLAPVGRLRVRVEAGDPSEIRGLTVSGSSLGDPRTGYARFEVATDAEGRFEVPAILAGSLSVSVRVPPNCAYVPRETVRSVIAQGRTTDLALPLVKGIPVRGSVSERESGRPIADAVVVFTSIRRVFGFRTVVRTDDEGRYTVHLAPGEWNASIADSAPYLLPAARERPVFKLDQDARDVVLAPLRLIAGGEVRGVVVDDGDRPVADATVDASWVAYRDFPLHLVLPSYTGTDQHVASSSTRTDQRGEFLLRDLPTDVRLWLSAQHEDSCTGPPLEVRAGATAPVTLRVSRENTHALGGQVVDEYNRPLAGVHVSISAHSWTPEGVEWNRFPSTDEDWGIRTDAAGRFQTPRRLRRDTYYQASASSPGRKWATTEYLAPTTPSFFKLVLYSLPAEQAPIQREYEAGKRALEQANYAEAERLFRTALDEADRGGIKDPVALSRWRQGLAESLYYQNKPIDAEVMYRRVLALREEALGPNHSAIAETLEGLASVYDQSKRYQDAEMLFKRALSIREQDQGPEHPQLAGTLYLLSNHDYWLGRYASAEASLRRAQAIQEKTLGDRNETLASTLTALARTTMALDKDAEAESLFRRSLSIREQVVGEDHSLTCFTIDRYAELLHKLGRVSEAAALEKRSGAARQRHSQAANRPASEK